MSAQRHLCCPEQVRGHRPRDAGGSGPLLGHLLCPCPVSLFCKLHIKASPLSSVSCLFRSMWD